MTSTHPTLQPMPAAIRNAGITLPPLFARLMRLEWGSIPPWAFLSERAIRPLQRELNTWLATRDALEPMARSVVPFADCPETKTVACFQVTPSTREVVLIQVGESFEILAILPSFEAWFRLAIDDMLRGGATFEAVEQPAGVGEDATPQPVQALPFETEDQPTSEDARSTTRRHLMSALRESEVDLDFVSAEAGDQPMNSPSIRRHHEHVRRERGEALFADMLFILTQHRYPDRMAKWLWRKILAHKVAMTRRLGRQVEITVASLDFLNQNQHLVEGSLVLCSEGELAQVADVALRDGLTGLFDQATFRARLTRELERVDRYQGPLSLLMLDLDRFKRLNDEHGHLTGDRVLKAVGKLLRSELRSVDLAARYGGEEFAVIVPCTALPEAKALAERIRLAVERRFEDDLGVTVSVGVAAAPHNGLEPNALIQAADEALYRSKQEGRNRTTCAPPSRMVAQ